MNQSTRAWIYRVLTAANPILIFYGVIEEQVAPLWMGLAGALLGTGLATIYTPSDPAKPTIFTSSSLPKEN